VPQSPSPAPEPEAEVVVVHLMPKNPKDVKAPAVCGAAPRRWSMMTVDAAEVTCPACKRVKVVTPDPKKVAKMLSLYTGGSE
jgi:hypothetical protein